MVSLSWGLSEKRTLKNPPCALICAQSPPRFLKLTRNMKKAIGTIMIPIALMNRLMEFMISELGRLYFLARAVSLLI